LKNLDPWFEYLADFRHALAHRIPLYIPPYAIPRDNLAAYHELERRKLHLLQQWDFHGIDQLEREQLALGAFQPWMQHSFTEGAKPIPFHPQMLADFNTVDEVGRKLLAELDRPQA
jgi:hypothetical protein